MRRSPSLLLEMPGPRFLPALISGCTLRSLGTRDPGAGSGRECALVTLETYRLLPSSILRALWKSCRVPAASDASRES